MKLSDKIKGYKTDIIDELKGKVYKISDEEKKSLQKSNATYNCDCTFTLEEATQVYPAAPILTEINMVLRPYKICEWCKDQMKRQIGSLGAVIAAIENGNLEADVMDTLKKTDKEN